jgi:drug/metabolite transporter (DMT)-like permease
MMPGVNRAAVLGLVVLVNASWAIGQTFWKRAMSAIPPGSGVGGVLAALLRSPSFYVGGAISAAGVLTWLFVLSKADLSFATPLVGMGIVFAAIFSVVLLNEPVGVMRIAGTALIAVGVALVARS